jgi:hypothetical protein
MSAVFRRALQLPSPHPLHETAWSVLDSICDLPEDHDPELASGADCSPRIRRTAIRTLRRRLAIAPIPTRWSYAHEVDASRLATLTGEPADSFAATIPTTTQLRRVQAMLGRPAAPALPTREGPSDRVIAVHAHGRAPAEASRWLAAQRGKTIDDVGELLTDFAALADARPGGEWTLVITRHADRGIVLDLDVLPGSDAWPGRNLFYRDGTNVVSGYLSEDAIERLFDRGRFRWHTVHPPAVAELNASISTSRRGEVTEGR